MVMVFWFAWQQKLNTLRHNLNYQTGDLYCAPLIPELLLDYTRKLCPTVDSGEKPYCLYFTLKDGGKMPVLILLTNQKLHYFNPYRPSTIKWGAIREVGCIPLGAIAQFEVQTRPYRTMITVNEQEVLTLPFRINAATAHRLQAAVELRKGGPTVTSNIKDTYLHPEHAIDGHDLADVTNHFLNQFVPLFNFYTSPFSAGHLQQIRETYGCFLDEELPLVHLPLDRPGGQNCGVLITTLNMYIVSERVQIIPLAQIYQAGLATVNNVVYLHVNGVCQGILYEEHSAFDERNTRVLQSLFRLYRRTLNRCKPVPASAAFPALYLHPDRHN